MFDKSEHTKENIINMFKSEFNLNLTYQTIMSKYKAAVPDLSDTQKRSSEKHKIYYRKNKEKIKGKRKQYYEKNHEKINQLKRLQYNNKYNKNNTLKQSQTKYYDLTKRKKNAHELISYKRFVFGKRNKAKLIFKIKKSKKFVRVIFIIKIQRNIVL